MRRIIIVLSGFWIILNGTTYYVAPWGNNNNPGTITLPWLTINNAAQKMVAGDSVLIMAGTYKESVNPLNSGNTSSPITYTNYNSEEVIVEGGEEVAGWIQDAGNRYRASVNFTPAPRFSDVRDPAGNYGGLVLQDGCKMRYAMSPSPAAVDSPGEYYMNDSIGQGPPYTMYVYVRDLGSGYDPNNYQMVIGRYRKGFDLDGGEDYEIVDGLIFRDFNDNAIHSIGSNYCQFKNLKLYSNFITGIYLTNYSRYNVIGQCTFWDNGHGGIELARSNSTTIKKSKFTSIDLGDGLGGNGAHVWLGPLTYYSDSCLLENNIGFKTGSDYIDGPFLAIRGGYNIIRHNSGINFGLAGIALIYGGNNTVINNAIDCNRGVAIINVFPDAVSAGGHFIQFNDFYAQDPIGKYRWDGVAYNSLAEWEAASGQSNNIDSVPGFVDPNNENLHLIPTSACIDAGTSNNASSEDYDGDPRPQGSGYDIGADEYVSGKVAEGIVPSIQQGGLRIRPNPARGGVGIDRLSKGSTGRLRVFNLTGRLVCELIFKIEESEIFWNLRDRAGEKLPAGNYYLVYTDDSSSKAERKIILLR